jgi:hypothetical protein
VQLARARVPLQVLRHKHIERDGVTSLVLACGAKREKQLHPRQLGEFQVRTREAACAGRGITADKQ